MSITRALPLALMALGGCGLIDSDIGDFALRLPEREITVDTADWMLSAEATLPAIDCGAMPEVCGTAVAGLCGADSCSGACGTDSTCEAVLDVSLWNTFDLAAESPELQQIEGQPLVSVTIDRVWYEVTENTLNVDSPALEVRVADQTIMTLADAEFVGTIAPVPAGMLVADAEVMLDAAGHDLLAARMKTYGTPFNLLVGTQLVIGAGDTLPTGRMVATVHVDAHAGI